MGSEMCIRDSPWYLDLDLELREIIVRTLPILRPLFKVQGHIKESQFLANGFPRLAWEDHSVLVRAISTGSRSWQSDTPVDEQPLCQGRFIHLNTAMVWLLTTTGATTSSQPVQRRKKQHASTERRRRARPKKQSAKRNRRS